jgi:hypothetical protein
MGIPYMQNNLHHYFETSVLVIPCSCLCMYAFKSLTPNCKTLWLSLSLHHYSAQSLKVDARNTQSFGARHLLMGRMGPLESRHRCITLSRDPATLRRWRCPLLVLPTRNASRSFSYVFNSSFGSLPCPLTLIYSKHRSNLSHHVMMTQIKSMF